MNVILRDDCTYNRVFKVAAVDPWWEGAVLNLPGYPERFEVTRGVPFRLLSKYKAFRERHKKKWAKKGYGCL